MIRIEDMDSWGFEHAVRGMRNSYNSWNKSDSFCCENDDEFNERCNSCLFFIKECSTCVRCRFLGTRYRYYYIIGENDLELMQKLIEAGGFHRKFLRQIFVSMDITAPLYWWKEFDTYKVGTTANSCSTMHTIHKKEFTLDDFSCEYLGVNELTVLKCIVNLLNINRNDYLEKEDKKFWYQMIQLLPSSYNQKRTVTMNYENVLNIIEQRANHKLNEWKKFIKILKINLPYADKLFISKEE